MIVANGSGEEWWPSETTGCSRTLAEVWVWVKPRKATTAEATTSKTRKTPVIQALARRSNTPMAVEAAITTAPVAAPFTGRPGIAACRDWPVPVAVIGGVKKRPNAGREKGRQAGDPPR